VGAARSAFDPQLNLAPSYDHTSQDLLVPTQTVSGAATTTTYQGVTSGLLPSSTSYSVSFNSADAKQTNPALLGQGAQSPSVNTTLTFSLTQPLLKGVGPTFATAPVKIAQYTADAAWDRLDQTTQQTISDVETAYWALGLAEAVERLSRDSYDRARELLTRNEKMLELKLIAEYDIITSRRGVEQRLAALTDATRRRQDAAENLLFLAYGRRAVEVMPERDSIRTEPPQTNVPPPPPVADLEKQALELRGDYLAARLDVSGSQLLTRFNRNALLPSLNVNGGYSLSTIGTDSVRLSGTSRVGDLSQHDWKVGMTFTYPLLNRAARAAYDRARFDTEALTENLTSVENLVRSQVRAAARGISTNLVTLRQAQASFDYAKKEYEGGQKQLQLGLIDSFRLLQINDDVSIAEQVLEQTRYGLAQAITNFGVAMGTSGQRYKVQSQRR
jgi:outer membrane protein TolC